MSDNSHQTSHPLDEVVEIEDRDRWLGILEEHFGMPRGVFEPYEIVRQSTKSINIVSRDHQPQSRPRPDIVGMPFMRTKMEYPKITTAAAMAFGTHACRNVVAVDREHADMYLARERFTASAEAAASCTGRGYVLVAYRGVTLGVGFLYPDENGGGEVRSMYPKAWTLDEQRSAFSSELD